jgi:hypothetical protein
MRDLKGVTGTGGVLLLILALLLVGCGKVKEATQVAKNVAQMAEAGKQMSKVAEATDGAKGDGVDWENYELTEADIRRFYGGVKTLHENHPDIDFEVAMTASLEAMGEGLDIEKVVEKETELTFEEYSGLSTALLLAQSEAAGVHMTEEMVSAMEDGLGRVDEMDQSELSEEEKAAIEEQRQALAEAQREIQSEEFQARKAKVQLIESVREEMGF